MDKYFYSDAVSLPLLLKAGHKIDNLIRKFKFEAPTASIHMALISAYIDCFSAATHEPISLLEIGTYDGVNARILCELHPNLRIKTFDVDPMSPLLTSVYPDGQSTESLKSHYKKRLASCSHPNISYEEKSSSFIFNRTLEFSDFSIFWIDGDHFFPQVSIDIINCLFASAPNDAAVILIDDVFADPDDPAFSTVSNICSTTDLYSLQWFQKRHSGEKGVMSILRSNSPSILLD